MAFTPKDWRNFPEVTTPLSAAAIENLETRVTDYADIRGPIINVMEYVTGAGTETANFLSAASAAETAGAALFIPPGVKVTINDDFSLWNGAQVIGYGGTLDILTDHSATGKRILAGTVVDVQMWGLTVAQSNANARNAVYGMISIDDGSDQDYYDITVVSGESTGFWMGSEADRIRLWRPKVSGTWADGIHCSNGCREITIDHAVVDDVGDDGIGIISYDLGTYRQMEDVTINNPVVTDSSNRSGASGNGITVLGANNVRINGGYVRAPLANGVSVTGGGTADNTYYDRSAGCHVYGVTVKDAPAGKFGFVAGLTDNSSFEHCWAHSGEIGFFSQGSGTATFMGGGAYDNSSVGVYEEAGSGSVATNLIGMTLYGNDSPYLLNSGGSATACVGS